MKKLQNDQLFGLEEEHASTPTSDTPKKTLDEVIEETRTEIRRAFGRGRRVPVELDLSENA